MLSHGRTGLSSLSISRQKRPSGVIGGIWRGGRKREQLEVRGHLKGGDKNNSKTTSRIVQGRDEDRSKLAKEKERPPIKGTRGLGRGLTLSFFQDRTPVTVQKRYQSIKRGEVGKKTDFAQGVGHRKKPID